MKINYSCKPPKSKLELELEDPKSGFTEWLFKHCCVQNSVLFLMRHSGVELPATEITYEDAFEMYESDKIVLTQSPFFP